MRAKHDSSFSAAVFDLKDVLITPKGYSKGFSHRRKLNTYNLTIFDYGKDLGVNNIWNERIAKRGSNEVGSCLFEFVKGKAETGVTSISLYSDACTVQNRNKYIAPLLWYLRGRYQLNEKHPII